MGLDFNANELGTLGIPGVGAISGLDIATVEVINGATATHDTGTVTCGYVRPGGTGGTGTYNLSGGALNALGVINNDIFNYSGGNLNADMTNTGTATLSGAGIRTVNGEVTNDGTFRVVNTEAQFTGTFTNNGAYISDPSENTFVDLVVSEGGYLVGGEGDNWYIQNNFDSRSTQDSLWNTAAASLGFVEGADIAHELHWTGEDLGDVWAGYLSNFAWGTLSVLDNDLTLFDGDDIAGGALYVAAILGLEFSPSGDSITNISNAGATDFLNIYYLTSQNPDLEGLTYNLGLGGQLIPVTEPVPIPGTVWLLVSALAAIVGFKRKFRQG